MIPYDPKAWFYDLRSVRGTVLRAIRWRLLLLVLLTGLVYAVDRVGQVAGESPLPAVNPLAHNIMGVTLGLLIVFRTNSAYDRFWEGRRLWGSVVNTSRNLVRGGAVYVGPSEELANLVTAYVLALKQHLRGSTDLTEVRAYLPAELFERAAASGNPPSTVALFLSAWAERRRAAEKLNFMQADRLEGYVAALLNDQGGCERILRTPIPFIYAVHIKQMLLFYLVTLPFVLVPLMGWVALPAFVLIAFGLLGIEAAGVEIEDPFGDDPNDLPLETICTTIANDVRALAKLSDQA